MRLDELDYDLPPDLIADRPSEPREGCRLMVVDRKTGAIEHRVFTDLPGWLNAGDLLVLNRARVSPARMFVHRPEHAAERIEILVVDGGVSWQCRALIRPSRKVRSGSVMRSAGGEVAIRAGERDAEGFWPLELEDPSRNWQQVLEDEGHVPLPPYILKRRADHSDRPEDRVWYQTAFADQEGAVAAPTAGLHFTEGMLQQVRERGVKIERLFLKVGPATFLPVRTETVEAHPMGSEEYEVNEATVARVAAARRRKGRVIAVGTTVVRTLESVADPDGRLRAGRGSTRLLIAPPFEFRVTDALITNFHLPRSTLLALVYALAGARLIRQAYAEAIARRYRFYSYGDAMLIL